MSDLLVMLMLIWVVINAFYLANLLLKFGDNDIAFDNDVTVGYILLSIICIPAILFGAFLLILFYLILLISFPFVKLFSIHIGRNK